MKRTSSFLRFVCVLLLAFVFVFGVTIIHVEAETVENSTQNSADLSEDSSSEEFVEEEKKEEIFTSCYVYKESEESEIKFIFLNDTDVQCVLFLNGEELATINAIYQRVGNVVDVYAADDYLGAFELLADGTAKKSYAWEDEEEAIEDSVNNEDSSDDIPNVTKTDDDEEYDLKPIILAGIVSIVGCLLLYAIFKGKIDGIIKDVNFVIEWFKNKEEDLSSEEVSLKEYKDSLVKAVVSNEEVKKLLEKAYEQNEEEYETLKSAIVNTAETVVSMYEKRAAVIAKQYEQIKGILVKLATGNADLVRNGLADEIIQMVENDKGE